MLIQNLNTGANKTALYSTTTGFIGSLNPSFTYQFTVSAVTVAESPYSKPINVTMPEDGNVFIGNVLIH